jgi:GNAT superfamily N-acetyltransferase
VEALGARVSLRIHRGGSEPDVGALVSSAAPKESREKADELEIRPYRPGDEAAIRELFQLAFKKPLSAEFWRWRFAENPVGEILIDLMWDGETLAGHYAVSPVIVRVGNAETKTALSMTTMTHPSYQGRGIFTRLARNLYGRMAAAGYGMVWGFPNNASHRGFVRDLAWEDVHEVPTFQLHLADARAAMGSAAAVQELSGFDGRFDALWGRLRGVAAVMVRRDRAYLEWRYGRHPENRYTVLGHVDGKELTGYAVLKRYERQLDVVDVLATDASAGAALVAAAVERARGAGCEAVNLWLNFASSLHSALEKAGFRNVEPVTYFGVCRFAGLPSDADVRSYGPGHLAMGDSDVY